jgi:hypothetical protein
MRGPNSLFRTHDNLPWPGVFPGEGENALKTKAIEIEKGRDPISDRTAKATVWHSFTD